MSRADILCKCTRCKHTHNESERVHVPHKSEPDMHELVCPKCRCKSFYDMTPSVAFAWASGFIEFGDTVPDGAIKIAEGAMSRLKSQVGVLARHGQGRSAGRLLVPGVPEAGSEKAKGDALAEWLEWCARGNGTKHRNGVVFMTAKGVAHEVV